MGANSFGSVATVACILFLLPARFTKAEGDDSSSISTSIPVDLPSTCLRDLAYLASWKTDGIKGAPKNCMPDQYM